MRLPTSRLLWASTALGTAAVLTGGSAQLAPTGARALAAGPTPGATVAASTDDALAPDTPDTALAPVVLAAVKEGGGVDLADGGTCPANRLVLSWSDPGPGWRSGGFIAPVGPPPTLGTAAVNGVVLCTGSHHAYVGFDAVRTAQGWDVELVPDPAGGIDEAPGSNDPDTAPRPSPVPAVSSWAGRAKGPAIEGYARYQGQTSCDPSAKPGMLALRDLLLARYGSTSSLGISRSCSAGGRSEHKEGRAFDWGANLGVAAERAAAEDFLRRLLATDSYGNRHALARRMGLMYVIWDHRIWSAYRADAGWRSYSGSSPHTDHVHMSMSWAGARGLTSFWSGDVVAGFPSAPVGGGGGSGRSTGTRTRADDRPTARPDGERPRGDGHDGSSYRRERTRPSPSPSPSSSPSASPTPSPSPDSVWGEIEDGVLDPLRPWGRSARQRDNRVRRDEGDPTVGDRTEVRERSRSRTGDGDRRRRHRRTAQLPIL